MPPAFRILACAAAVMLFADAARADGPPSFVNDVVPVFTRYGCNQGACHGKGAGQNGFRLTLRGYAPELDYQYLTREFSARRICTDVPEESLLLRKPSGLVPHEGGKVFDVGSRPYQVLLSWIRAGLPGPIKDEPVAVKLEIRPGDRTAKPGDEGQLTVRAVFSDGGSRDVTWLTKFASNDPGTADVDAFGKVRVLRNGETSIRAAFQTLVAVVDVAVPFDQPVDPARLGRPQQLHRRPRFRQARRPAHRAVRPLHRRRVPPPRFPRHDRRPAHAGRGAGVPGRYAAGQAGAPRRCPAGAAGIRRLLDRSTRRFAPEPQGARPRRARPQGRALLPRMDSRAGRGEPAVGRDGPRSADRQGAGRRTTPPSAITSSTSARSARPPDPRSSVPRRRRFSASASAAPSATTTRWSATRRTTITTSPATSRASTSTARSRARARRC